MGRKILWIIGGFFALVAVVKMAFVLVATVAFLSDPAHYIKKLEDVLDPSSGSEELRNAKD